MTAKAAVYWERDKAGETVIPYIGGWARHGLGVFVREDGEVVITWRTYQWCGPNVTGPCDQIDEAGTITPGGRLTGVLHTFDLPHADGTLDLPADSPISSSFRLSLLPDGLAELQIGDAVPEILCGPRFADLAPLAVREQYPCGA